LKRARIIYADFDLPRLRTVTEVLTGAGYAVWPCLGDAPPTFSGTPDLVLLCPRLDETLYALAATLWPKIPRLVLRDAEDYGQLPLRIESMLRKPGAH
jgi:hypothetical protein